MPDIDNFPGFGLTLVLVCVEVTKNTVEAAVSKIIRSRRAKSNVLFKVEILAVKV